MPVPLLNGVYKKDKPIYYLEKIDKPVPASFIVEEKWWEQFKAICAYRKLKPSNVLCKMIGQYIENSIEYDGLDISDLANIKKLPIPAEDDHAPLGKPEADILEP